MSQEGLRDKYLVLRGVDAGPVPYPCFVLRIDGKDKAAICALRAYAIATRNMELKKDLMDLADRAEAGE